MTVFVSGGCKNGKSSFAEKTAATLSEGQALYYVATMRPTDDEDCERIARHRRSRQGLAFETIEISENISNITQVCDLNGTFLIDSTTALLANEMFPSSGNVCAGIYEKIAKELLGIIEASKNVVIVSDYIYSDAYVYSEHTELFRKELAKIDAVCAKYCDAVVEMCFGNAIYYKGSPEMSRFGKEVSLK